MDFKLIKIMDMAVLITSLFMIIRLEEGFSTSFLFIDNRVVGGIIIVFVSYAIFNSCYLLYRLRKVNKPLRGRDKFSRGIIIFYLIFVFILLVTRSFDVGDWTSYLLAVGWSTLFFPSLRKVVESDMDTGEFKNDGILDSQS